MWSEPLRSWAVLFPCLCKVATAGHLPCTRAGRDTGQPEEAASQLVTSPQTDAGPPPRPVKQAFSGTHPGVSPVLASTITSGSLFITGRVLESKNQPF